MQKRTLLRAALIVVIQTGTVLAQGAFLKKGESGLGVGAGFTTNKDAFGYGGSLGYSISGYFDLSGSVSGTSVSMTPQLEFIGSSYRLSVTSFDFGGTAYISREDSANQPFDLAVSVDYERDYYSSQALSSRGINISGEDFTFGGTLFRNISVSPMDYLQPSVTVAFLISAVTTNQGPYSGGTSENILVYSAGLTYVVKNTFANEFLFTPAVAIDKHDVTFSLTAGIVFPTSS